MYCEYVNGVVWKSTRIIIEIIKCKDFLWTDIGVREQNLDIELFIHIWITFSRLTSKIIWFNFHIIFYLMHWFNFRKQRLARTYLQTPSAGVTIVEWKHAPFSAKNSGIIFVTRKRKNALIAVKSSSRWYTERDIESTTFPTHSLVFETNVSLWCAIYQNKEQINFTYKDCNWFLKIWKILSFIKIVTCYCIKHEKANLFQRVNFKHKESFLLYMELPNIIISSMLNTVNKFVWNDTRTTVITYIWNTINNKKCHILCSAFFKTTWCFKKSLIQEKKLYLGKSFSKVTLSFFWDMWHKIQRTT